MFGPLSLPQDAVDLHHFFLPDESSGILGERIELPEPVDYYHSPGRFCQGLSAHDHDTGKFTSVYDFFIESASTARATSGLIDDQEKVASLWKPTDHGLCGSPQGDSPRP